MARNYWCPDCCLEDIALPSVLEATNIEFGQVMSGCLVVNPIRNLSSVLNILKTQLQIEDLIGRKCSRIKNDQYGSIDRTYIAYIYIQVNSSLFNIEEQQ